MYYDSHNDTLCGFNVVGKWTKEFENDRYLYSSSLIPATDTEVKEALEKEAVKRGYNLNDVSNIKCLFGYNSDKHQKFYKEKGKFIFKHKHNNMWIRSNSYFSVCIFKDGIWAEIIEEPELITYTVTEAMEALKKANPGKRITIEI